MSLGYRSALADLIFAHVLVAYGQHFIEKRRFEFVADYLDTILTLDPRFREPVRLADTFVILQPEPARVQDYRAARRLLERGLAMFPNDSELWLIAGQFMAYLAANNVPEAEREQWRFEGAKKLARSCELVGSNENIPHHCIVAARLFNEAGQAGLARNFLERVLAVSDDPEIQDIASGYLGRVVGAAERERIEERGRKLRALWSHDLTFVSRDAWFLLGPRFDSAHCAGLPSPQDPACPTSFRAWGEAEVD
jgi:tetratricopeptide (TPR) repeat protein